MIESKLENYTCLSCISNCMDQIDKHKIDSMIKLTKTKHIYEDQIALKTWYLTLNRLIP